MINITGIDHRSPCQETCYVCLSVIVIVLPCHNGDLLVDSRLDLTSVPGIVPRRDQARPTDQKAVHAARL